MDLKKSVVLKSFPHICIVELLSNDTLQSYKLTIIEENELIQIFGTYTE